MVDTDPAGGRPAMPELAERWHAEQTGKVLEYLGGTAVDLVSDHTRTGWFMPDLVDQLDLAPFYRAHRDDGHGHPAHDPTLSLGVLLYGYCLGLRHPPAGRALLPGQYPTDWSRF